MYSLQIPKNTKILINKQSIKVKGPFGSMVKQKSEDIIIYVCKNNLYILDNNLIYFTLLKNIILGVSRGYSKKLKIIGVEFKIVLRETDIVFRLGFSHDVIYKIPHNIKIYNPKSNILVIVGYDKQLVAQIAAEIRHLKLPEPYKGKGILYFNEILSQKDGKKT